MYRIIGVDVGRQSEIKIVIIFYVILIVSLIMLFTDSNNNGHFKNIHFYVTSDSI